MQDIPDFLLDPITDISEIVSKYNSHVTLGKFFFEEFLSVWEHRIEILDIETPIYSDFPSYAGRFDFKFLLKEAGKTYKCIGDIKTSKQIRIESVSCQLTAYQKALVDFNADRIYALKIHPYSDKDIGWEFKRLRFSWKPFEKAYDKFVAYWSQKGLPNPPNYTQKLVQREKPMRIIT